MSDPRHLIQGIEVRHDAIRPLARRGAQKKLSTKPVPIE